MLSFIDNLVHKAIGSSLLTKPEPSTWPSFEIFSRTLDATMENLPFEPSQSSPTNSHESIITSKTTSEEVPSTSSFKNHPSMKKELQEPLSNTSTNVAEIPVTPQIPISNKRITKRPAPTNSNNEEVLSKSANISAVGQLPSILRTFETSGTSKPLEHSVESTSEHGRDKQTSSSILLKPQAGAQHDNYNKFSRSLSEPSIIDSEIYYYQPAPEMPPAKGKVSLIRNDEIHVVNVEPSVESRPQTLVNELISKTSSAALSTAVERNDVIATQAQPHNEVRVNIGRIEIKASQQSSHPVKPPPRGFEDHVMMRLYLERHFF